MILAAAVDGNEEIIVSEADKEKITPELLERVNEALKSKGKQAILGFREKKEP